MSKISPEDINKLFTAIHEYICNVVDDRTSDADDSMVGFSGFASGKILQEVLAKIFKKLER